MLTLLKRWLGWEADSDFYRHAAPRKQARPSSATAHLFAKDGGKKATPAPVARRPAAAPKPRRKLEVVEPDPNFDPYNTGKFDRSASWERISKNQR